MRFVAISSVLALALGLPTSGVGSMPWEAGETHCVVYVVGQQPDGEFIVSDLVCYSGLGEALSAASGGLIEPNEIESSGDIFTDKGLASVLSTFTLGIHFDGFNGQGSSISVVGDSCIGGWWNTGSSWANKISSSWNGCYRLRHHDGPNKTGASADTVGSGTHNIPS
ncbi:MAG: hypothetical protein WB245_08335, partial [Acidimicrobiia bacterium]